MRAVYSFSAPYSRSLGKRSAHWKPANKIRGHFMKQVDGKSRALRGLWAFVFSAFLVVSPSAGATESYYRHVIFDNSLATGNYFYSTAQSSGHSYLEQTDRRL